MILGAGRRTTTGDGSTATISVGPGILAHGSGGITGRRGWGRSLAAAGGAGGVGGRGRGGLRHGQYRLGSAGSLRGVSPVVGTRLLRPGRVHQPKHQHYQRNYLEYI